MAGSGPQAASPPHAESVNVRQPDEFPNFEQENHVDNQREGSSRTTHVRRSGYRRKSPLAQEHADEQDLQQEIDDLNSHMYFGHIGPHLGGPPERPPSQWPMELKQLSPRRLGSQRWEQVHSIQRTTMKTWREIWTWSTRKGKTQWSNWLITNRS